ncbi:MAG: hypothetical protein NXI32_23040 [bacterium]|nr:hypothetical protein [bacterium]
MLASENQVLNPYQPPSLQSRALEDGNGAEQGLLGRDGDRLLISNGAVLPPICFVSGVPTQTAVDVVFHWQPRWVYGLLLAGIVPYFLISPFVQRKVSLRIPIAKALYRRHASLVLIGARLLFASLLLFGFSVVLLFLANASSWMLLIALVVGFVGALLGSRHAVSLNVISLDHHLLTLGGVHPKVLDSVPEVAFSLETASSQVCSHSPAHATRQQEQ